MLQLVNGEHLPDLGVGTWTLRGDTAAANVSGYLDFLLVHWPVKDRIKDTWQVMEEYVRLGKVRSIGVCNFNPHHLEDLLAYARIKPVMNQIELHPLHSSQQEPEIQRRWQS